MRIETGRFFGMAFRQEGTGKPRIGQLEDRSTCCAARSAEN
jgi:hypothetical protein